MNRSGSSVKRSLTVVKQFLFLIFIVSAFVTVKPAYSEEEAIEVSCYKDNSPQGLNVGNVSITRPETAAENCNATYYDCNDKCVGCFYDQKLGQTVCYNAGGEKVAQ